MLSFMLLSVCLLINTLDFNYQQLAAVENDIKDLVRQKVSLSKKAQTQELSFDEKEELSGVAILLGEAQKAAIAYRSFITLTLKDTKPVSKSFSEADEQWISDVTEVDTNYRKWDDYESELKIDIRPGPEFKTGFENICKAFQQSNEAGRRLFLNLFLSDIILRPEFEQTLRIFLELPLTVERAVGDEKRKLTGRMDYTIGFAKDQDIFSISIPNKVHLVAVEAKLSFSQDDLRQCIAEAACLYKTRVDAGKENRQVWGILSNANQWQFIYINEEGLLWRSEMFYLDLRTYDESKVSHVYRMLHYVITMAASIASLP